jgi:hypothetical protein
MLSGEVSEKYVETIIASKTKMDTIQHVAPVQ